MTPPDAHTLLEHGNLGLMVVIILAVVAPIVGIMGTLIVWQIRGATKQQTQARADFMSVIKDTSDRQERTTVALTEVSVGQVRALDRLCSRLEERPCLLGARLANSSAADPAGSPAQEG